MAIVLAAILFNVQIGPLTPLTVLAGLGAVVVLRYDRLPGVLGRSWPLLALPLLAMASALWSDVPFTTVRYGFLYFLTALTGILMGGALHRNSFFKGMLLATGVFSLAGVALGDWVPMGVSGRAFAGLSGSKNSAGDMAALGVLATLAAIAWAFSRRSALIGAVALILLPAQLFILLFSRSIGAWISFGVATACFVLWMISRHVPLQARVAIFAVALIGVVGMLLAYQLWLPPLFDTVLEASGKGPDLTGRTLLWIRADQLIAERPWLGMGYNTFWLHHNLDAEYLWRVMGIKSREGFNFHSTPKEIIVHLGYVGLVVYAAVAVYCAGRLLTNLVVRPSIFGVFASVILVYLTLKLPFEVIGFGTMHFATILAFAALAAGLRGTPSLPQRQDRPRAKEVPFPRYRQRRGW